MNYLDLTIEEIHEALLSKKVTVLELVKEALKRAKEDANNDFELILEEDAIKKAIELDKKECPKDNIFFGMPYCAKDNFSTKGYETTASSNILNGYVPIFDATVIKLLNEKGAILIAKTTLDELAMGGTGTSGHKGITYNPYKLDHSTLIGGSSCGSCAAVASGIVPFALGSDTGDSVRKPASYGGLVGFKPTWGLISRYGLFPFAPSLDHVAFFTRSVKDASFALDLLSVHDENDYTSYSKERKSCLFDEHNISTNKKIGILKEVYDSIDDDTLKNSFDKLIIKLKEVGYIVDFVSIDKNLLSSIYPSYIVISSAEATSNNANLDGIKFGPYYDGKTYQEVMINARTKGFSPLIKRRFVLGSYALMKENQEEVFKRAQKVRHLIVNKANEILSSYDFIIGLAAPSVAKKVGEVSEQLSDKYLIADNYLAIGNFGGFPSITLPLGFKDGLPFGVNLTSKPYSEKELFEISYKIEEITGLKNLSVNNKKEGL